MIRFLLGLALLISTPALAQESFNGRMPRGTITCDTVEQADAIRIASEEDDNAKVEGCIPLVLYPEYAKFAPVRLTAMKTSMFRGREVVLMRIEIPSTKGLAVQYSWAAKSHIPPGKMPKKQEESSLPILKAVVGLDNKDMMVVDFGTPNGDVFEATFIENANVVKYDMMVRTVVPVKMFSNSWGSGVIISSGDVTRIVSAYHVTVGEEWIKVKIDGKLYEATLVKEDQELDLSILEVNIKSEYVAHIHQDSTLQVFDEVFTVGSGMGVDPYPAKALVSRLNSRGGLFQYIGHIIRGQSGGGVFRRHNDHYELVGIIKMVAVMPIMTPFGPLPIPTNNVGFASPMKAVMGFLDEKLN